MSQLKKLMFTDSQSGIDIGLLLLRLTLGLTLLYGHGAGKLAVIFSGQEIQFMDPIGIGATSSFFMAAFAEGICAILLVVGLFSRFASFVLAVNFLVILFFHAFIAKDGFEILELRYLYLLPFIALTFMGPGRFALDRILFRTKE